MSRAPAHPAARRRLLAAALLAAALLFLGPDSGRGADPTIEATGTTLGTFAWSPSTAEVSSGGSVTFKNPTGTPHALAWESGPGTPSCTGTPGAGQANWSGSCTFAQAGTYQFYCPVHPVQMKGTITASGPGAPAVSTSGASGVGETAATLNGSVNPSGQATTYYFEYGTTAAYGQKTAETSAGEGTAAVPKSAAVSGLSAATTYHFRIVAKNATGTTLGGDRTFATTGPPTATTTAATTVGDTEATLAGTANPNGHATTYFFEYGTTAAYGQKTAEKPLGAGSAAVPVSALLSGLAPLTTYHFQLVASSSAGTVEGSDRTFTTLATPLAPIDPAAPAQPSPPPLSTPPPPPAAAVPPDTKITSKPRARTGDRTPTVKFAATSAGATFRCSVDGRPFKACRSPFTTPPLKPGRHTIRVAALVGGLADPTPAACSFKVLAAKKR